MRTATLLRLATLGGVLLGPSTATAAAPSATATTTSAATVDAEAQRAADREARRLAIEAEAQRSVLRRHAPRARSWEAGLFGGVAVPSRGLNLRDDRIPFRRYARVAGDFGLRLGYYPLALLGVEGEFGLITARVEATDASALMYSARIQPVVQVPFWRIAPFATLGLGVLGVSSDATAMGTDADFMFSYGGGVKVYINRNIGLRLDVRTNLSQKYIDPDAADTEEYLLGLVVRLGPKPQLPPPPPDSDGDSFIDPEDACPDEVGVAPDGCPIRDSDGDGFLDPEDSCPDEAGVAPDGCPIRDGDGDGFLDDVDECPEEPGIDPDGCPVRDTDGDGIYDDVDQCVDEPETKNNYKEADGCPDEVPKEVKIFIGQLQGIVFETGKAKIRKRSLRSLRRAAQILRDYPELKVEISGHTDSRGSREVNMKLSAARASAVETWLLGEGIEAERLTTRGAGPDEPVAENSTKKGRATNRRIEFKLVP